MQETIRGPCYVVRRVVGRRGNGSKYVLLCFYVQVVFPIFGVVWEAENVHWCCTVAED